MADDTAFTVTPEVPGPRTDRPAADDPLVKAMIRLAHRTLWWSLARYFGLCAVGGLLAFVDQVAIAAIALAGGVFLIAVALRALALFRALEKIMATQAWRPVRVRGLMAKDRRVEVQDGDDVRYLKGCVPEFHAQILARQPVAWLVGPDSRGRVALRFPGLHTPLALRTAKDAAGYREMRPKQPHIDPAAPASDDVVALRGAKVMRRRVHARLYWPLIVAAWAVIGYVFALSRQVIPAETAIASALAVAAAVLVTLIWALTRWQKFRAYAAMPKLLAAGPWQRHPVRLTSSYRPGKYATDDVSVVVDVDGVEVPFVLHHAVPDLVGYIEDTDTIWLAGSPHSAGRAIAVGVPGYPILGIAYPSTSG